MAAREPVSPLVLRLLVAFRPELAEVAEETIDEAIGALGPDGIERIRAAGAAVGKVLNVIEARRAEMKGPRSTGGRSER